MPRPIADVLRDLDRLEVDVPAGLADEVWSRLFAEEPPIDIRTRRRPPWFFLTAAAAVIALLATAAFIVLPTSDGALAIVRRAQERFAAAPPLTVVVARTVEEDSSLRVTRIDYENDERWRAEILEDTQTGATGDIVLSDGTYVGSYSRTSEVFRVEPADASGPQRPLILVSPEQLNGSEEDCRFVDEETVAGRRTQHITCAAQAIPGEVEPGERTEAWFDAEHGLLLRIRHPNGISHEVRSIEYDVEHPDDRFSVAAPQGAQIEWAGEGAAPEQFTPRRPTGPGTTVVDPDRPGEVIVTPAGEVWVSLNGGEETDLSNGRIARIDPTTGEVKEIVPVPKAPMGWPDDGGQRDVAAASEFAVIGDTLYVFDAFSFLVHRFDLRTRAFVGATMTAGDRDHQPMRMLVHDGAIWIVRVDNSPVTVGGREAQGVLGQVVRLGADGAIAQTIGFDGSSYGGAVSAHGSLWVTAQLVDRRTTDYTAVVHRIGTAASSVIATIRVPGDHLVADDNAVWAASYDGKVSRIDPATNSVAATIDVPGGATSAVVAGGRLWVLNPDGASVSHIDPASNTVSTKIDVGLNPYGIAAGDGTVWVTVGGTRSIVRIPV